MHICDLCLHQNKDYRPCAKGLYDGIDEIDECVCFYNPKIKLVSEGE